MDEGLFWQCHLLRKGSPGGEYLWMTRKVQYNFVYSVAITFSWETIIARGVITTTWWLRLAKRCSGFPCDSSSSVSSSEWRDTWTSDSKNRKWVKVFEGKCSRALDCQNVVVCCWLKASDFLSICSWRRGGGRLCGGRQVVAGRCISGRETSERGFVLKAISDGNQNKKTKKEEQKAVSCREVGERSK